MATRFLIFVILLAIPSNEAAKSSTTTSSPKPWENSTSLREHLLRGYDKFALPPAQLLPIKMILKNGFVDEQKSALTIDVIMQVRWIDSRLQWNESSEYDFSKRLVLNLEDVALPDINLIDNVSPLTEVNRLNSHLTVNPRGTLLWVLPSVRLSVFCDTDLREWPFHTKVCSMHFRSTHNDLADTPKHHHRLHMQVENETWHSAERLSIDGWYLEWREVNVNREHYEDIAISKDATFRFILQRTTAVISIVHLLPILVVTLLCLSVFWTSPTSSIALCVNSLSVCFLCALALYYDNQYPYFTSSGTPVLMLVYSCFLHLVFFAMFVNTIVLSLSKTPPMYGLPWCTKAILTGRLKNFLFTANYAIQVSRSRGPSHFVENSRISGEAENVIQQEEAGPSSSSAAGDVDRDESQRASTEEGSVCERCLNKQANQAEWTLLAVSLHHAAFFVYFIIFTTLLVFFTVSYK